MANDAEVKISREAVATYFVGSTLVAWVFTIAIKIFVLISCTPVFDR